MPERPETPITDSAEDRLTVSVRRESGAGVVALAGELDHDTAPLLADAALALADDGVAYLVIDCSGLRFCDSTGLNVLLKARLRTVDDGGRFALAGVGPQLRRLLELTGADGVFETHADVAAALAAA
ncbi:STAS domain-containing protein [Streptacidiphilus jiangxiensis]|uniref:Anti-sigma factor antagonist n=1 Tax=Streptacidiphilus jiangxiensis TaxID=235985 RepID=A0A1H7N5V5_STRJI|nr:STAS domain-containing protein [Streptacidiphilus jiangxiensis]SEL18257.1 stage II sporulation protein AA (anti-sigma F factor antagonist) [Streptacidiphilus jiangxiensis]